MKFKQLYSGSTANAYVVTASNGKRLLIECGVTWPKLLKALNHNLDGIEACLLSHEHKDHSKAVVDVMKAGIDVYASEGTFEALGITPGRKAHVLLGNRNPLITESQQVIKHFIINAYGTNHDAEEPLLFVIWDDSEYLLFATDTSHIVQQFTMPFSIIAIECSYDGEILQRKVEEKTINETLAKRLLTSHLETKNTMRYLEEHCDLSKCREIHLIHMSGGNISKHRAKKECENKFFIETIVKEDKNANVPSN